MFSEKLSALLADRGISALTLAREIGVPKTMVYEWKTGVREPSAANLRRLGDYFGVSVGWLLEQQTSDDEELLVLLRRAKELSPREHDELVASFKQSLNRYLSAKQSEGEKGEDA